MYADIILISKEVCQLKTEYSSQEEQYVSTGQRTPGGSNIKSVASGTKPAPQWCPKGLTHTQKRRVQRLRTLEIKEEIAEKKHDKWFNQDKPMIPTKTWKEKRIAAKENKNTDDTIIAENSKSDKDVPTDMDVNVRIAC